MPGRDIIVVGASAGGVEALGQLARRPTGRAVSTSPARFHMFLKNGHVRLTPGPTKNSHLPAIDPLLRTAASRGGGKLPLHWCRLRTDRLQ